MKPSPVTDDLEDHEGVDILRDLLRSEDALGRECQAFVQSVTPLYQNLISIKALSTSGDAYDLRMKLSQQLKRVAGIWVSRIEQLADEESVAEAPAEGELA